MKFSYLKSLRVRFGFKQEDFGKLIGCLGPNYSSKENGEVNWSLKECYILTEFVNTQLKKIDEPEIPLTTLFPRQNFFTKKVSNRKQRNSQKT